MQEARILVRKPKEEKISPHTWHGRGLLDGGSLRDACTATVAVVEFCFGWYWEVTQGSLNGTHFEGSQTWCYNVAGSFEGYPLMKKGALFELVIHHNYCDLRSSIPKWRTVFGLQKKESRKFVLFIGWKTKSVLWRKCWEGDDRGGSENPDCFFLTKGWLDVCFFLPHITQEVTWHWPNFFLPWIGSFSKSSPKGEENP